MKKTMLKTAMAAAMGAGLATAPVAQAGVGTYSWEGVFTMLAADGAALENSSKPNGKSGNNFQTNVTGTMQFDTVTGAGTATLVPFDFFGGSTPAEAVGIKMQSIGNGTGGPGFLVAGNMLFNWNGVTGIPVSLVLDASGFFQATNTDFADGMLTQAEVAGTGATPASDGTYTNAIHGYTGIGPAIMATTDWNTTNINGCATGACSGIGSSGGLPLVTDTAVNVAQAPFTGPSSTGTSTGIGGNPMQDGPFQGSNANFDVTKLTFSGFDPLATIEQGCTFDNSSSCPTTVVPVPAAVWLFGSGLLGLVGVARRKQQS